MRIDELKRIDFSKHNLGNKVPPKDALESLQRVRKNLELVWNEDSNRWEIYMVKYKNHTDPQQDWLVWQNSSPEFGSNITPGIATWLRKFDRSAGGRFDLQDMRKNYLRELKEHLEKEEIKKNKIKEEGYYEINNVTRVAAHYVTNRKGASIVVPEIVGVTDKGKTVRLFKRDRKPI